MRRSQQSVQKFEFISMSFSEFQALKTSETSELDKLQTNYKVHRLECDSRGKRHDLLCWCVVKELGQALLAYTSSYCIVLLLALQLSFSAPLELL